MKPFFFAPSLKCINMSYQYDRAVVPATLYWQLKLGKCEQLLEVASIDNYLFFLFVSFFQLLQSGTFFCFFFSSFWKVEAVDASIDNTESSVLPLGKPSFKKYQNFMK